MLTEHEINAIRYYMGDVEGSDPFWSDPKAYVVLNSLFFPGIRTETDRVREGKRLNPAILEDPERLHQLLSHLLSACRKCALAAEHKSFRVERYSDYAEMKSVGKTVSFTSTSTAGFLSAYSDRKGIALMEFILPPGTPCIPMAAVLPHYVKAEEAEILLPPGVGLTVREKTVPEKFRTILDADEKPPIVYAEVKTTTIPSTTSVSSSLPTDGNQAGKRFYEALMTGTCPSMEDIAIYIQWKTAFVRNLY